MVANYGSEEQMIMRPRVPASTLVSHTAIQPQSLHVTGPGTFVIEVPAADGAMLLRMFERDGMLAVEGDETRWEEATRRFVYQMLQWSGLVGLRWKDEAQKTAQG